MTFAQRHSSPVRAFKSGFPTKATVETLYDEMDFQRAVLAYQCADTLVSFYSMNIGFKAVGANEGDLIVMEKFLDPKAILLTGNTTTIYGMSFLDLDKEGPMVVEVTPGDVFGSFSDLWQVRIGAIADKGGTFVVASDDFKGSVPAGPRGNLSTCERSRNR